MQRFATLALGALLASFAPQAPAEGPRLLWREARGDEATAIDLVFLPDGFLSAEQALFEDSVRKAVRLLGEHPATFLPAGGTNWNVHVGFAASEAHCPSEAGAPARVTAYRTHLSSNEEGGLFESDDTAVARAARSLCAEPDGVVVVVRSDGPVPFATGDLPLEGARIRLPLGFEEALLHELGHSLFALGDEYVQQHSNALPAGERCVVPFYPNLTLDPTGGRFRHLGVAEPELEEGALYYRRGVFRARGPCVMRDHGAERFCPPCAAVIAAGLGGKVRLAAPRCTLLPPEEAAGSWRVELASAVPEQHVTRRLVVLFRLEVELDDATLQARFAAAEARLSRKTRYMESSWLGDGSVPGETLFSLEPHLTSVDLGRLASGRYVLVAAQADLRARSPLERVSFEVVAK